MDTPKVLMDSDIDELMSDWFDRDGTTFIKVGDHARIGWEDSLSEDESYSAYILKSPDKLELLKRAYSLATDMIVAMDIPFKVKVRVNTKTPESYTDGKNLCVTTSMFDDKTLSVGEQLDAFLGTTIHEGCHLLYSDFKIFSEGMLPVVKALCNIIEDERIEQFCGQDKPGLARFLEKSKYYWFDSFYLENLTKEKPNLFERLFGIFLRIMRYPTYLKEEDIVFFGHHLFVIKDIVKDLPKDTIGSYQQALKVFEVFKEFYEEVKKEKDEKEKKRSEVSSDSGEAGDSGEYSDSEDSSDSEDEDTGGSKDSKKPTDPSEKPTKGSSSTPKEAGEEPGGTSFSTIDKDSKDLIEKFDKEFSAPKLDVSKELSDGVKSSIIEGDLLVGKGTKTFFKKATDNKSSYLDSLRRVTQYVPAISKIIKGHCKEYKLIHRSMRSGVLDTSKLAEAFQGVSTVYLREGEVKTDKIAVVMLIDQSGSMYGDRIRAAKDTAVLLNEAIGAIPNVDLYIYGHTGDRLMSGSTELIIYREKDIKNKYSLGSVEAYSENRDGTAIRETAIRVRKFTSEQVLMFILSDGEPAASDYHGPSAMEDVRSNVMAVEKMGFSVVQVCINHSYDPARMFKHFVILEDMSKLAVDLGKVIKKATLQSAKVRVS